MLPKNMTPITAYKDETSRRTKKALETGRIADDNDSTVGICACKGKEIYV